MAKLTEVEAWDDDDEVAPSSAEIMAQIDAMPKAWRALVYEFGFLIVRDMRDDVDSVRDARTALSAWRQHRQREWLATNYIVPASRFEKAH